jgi:hypothetical protein
MVRYALYLCINVMFVSFVIRHSAFVIRHFRQNQTRQWSFYSVFDISSNAISKHSSFVSKAFGIRHSAFGNH